MPLPAPAHRLPARPHSGLIVAVVLCLTAAPAASAGPLTPPAGPVQSTFKTLAEVEPRIAIGPITTPGDADATPSLYKITQPGSYILTADVTVTGDRHGIEIASHDVTIDLNGFTIRGANVANRAGIIENLHQMRSVEVRNGAIRDFALAGVHFHESDDWSGPRVGRIERLRVSNCGVGIGAGRESIVADCVITGGQTGIVGFGELVVERCHVLNTQAAGIVSITGASTVRHCRLDDTGDTGVRLTQGLVESCEVRSAGQVGVELLSQGVVRGCSVSGSGIGIEVGAASTVEANTVYAYRTVGIRADQRSRVVGNHVFYGFSSDPSSVQIGIEAPNGLLHIDGNTIGRADVGISSAAGGCTVIRNVLSDCTSWWSLSGSNQTGPLITATGLITSTNPWANLAQ